MNILKKRTIQKISAAGIAMAVVCTITTPICCMAEITDHRNSATLAEVGEGTYQTDVYAYQESSYNVTLPKTIILNGITNITNKINAGEYSVNVNGNINGAEIVNVIPKSNVRHINTHHDSDTAEGDGTYSCTDLNENEVQFYMGQTNKNDIKATVNQTKTEFNVSELIDNKTAATTGTITTKLTAGSWKGAFNFDISLKEKDANYSTAIKSWDVSRDTTNGDNVTMTYYAQEGANLSADTYEGGTLVFSGHGRMIGDIENNHYISDMLGTFDKNTGEVDYKYSPAKIVIKDGIYDIGAYAFSYMTNLQDVEIGNTVVAIGNGAFYGTGIKSIKIPNSVTLINLDAFSDCKNLTKVKLSERPNYINTFIFDGCTNLTEVYIPSKPEFIEYKTFYDMAPNSKIYCKTQEIANLLIADEHYDSTKTTVVVDAAVFDNL